MNIAYLSVFYPYRGGIAQFNAALFGALEKRHRIHAFTFKRQYPDFLFPGKTQYVTETDTAVQIPARRIVDTLNPFTWRTCAKEIIRSKPDLLLIQQWMPFFAPSLGYIAKSVKTHGIPVISLMANVIPHEHKPGDEILTKYFLNRSDAFIVLASAVGKDLLKLRPDAKFECHPHPNYAHFGKKIHKDEAREKLGLPKEKKIILFFGLIRKYKGLDLLIEAVAGLPEDYHLLIAGEVYGDDESYTNIITEKKLESRVSFHNRFLNDDELHIFFSAADVCVLPYRTATQSGIVGIAYQFELPVISTDVGGLKEVIEPYGCGIIVERPDSGLIRSAILDYFNSGNAEQYKQNIRNAQKHFSWESLADVVERLYSQLLIVNC
ncbi:MAG: Group 1 Glycosyl Transferase [Ignavibacteria bacterium]|nr:Group 1 Glycosyl Transferase [Ignavibacteria bacterium]